MLNEKKVFCIGLSRTGTTSLHLALVALGVSAIHYPARQAIQWINGEFSRKTTAGFQAFSDIPVGVFFKQLHIYHSDALFVYTRRDPEKWLDSVRRHIESAQAPNQFTVMRDYIRISTYGVAQFEESRFLDVYHGHEEKVREYFRHDPDSLLTIDLDSQAGMGWESLVNFFGLDAPGIPFPYARNPKLGRFGEVHLEEIKNRQVELHEQLRQA